MRQDRSLGGEWEFQLDPGGELTVAGLAPDRRIPVPLTWQAAFPELRHYSGYAWYRRSVDLDDQWLHGELLLRFGAVDYWRQVFVNRELAGEHEGGYTPITLPIRRYARRGRNEIAVRVYDVAQTEIAIPRWPDQSIADDRPGPPFAANDVPHGKQEWYIHVGGIWQDVTLAAVPATYIDHVRITPDIHTGQVSIEVETAGRNPESGRIRVRVGTDEERAIEAAARVHKRLEVDNPLGLPFKQIMPQGTILGLPAEDHKVQGDFLAGMISGWSATRQYTPCNFAMDPAA